MLSKILSAKVAAVALAGVLSAAGAAAAATGSLPDDAQNAVAHAGDAVGLSLPEAATGHANSNANLPTTLPANATATGGDEGTTNDDQGTDDTDGGGAGSNNQPDNHGACVSAVAQDHTTGADVADAAKSDCGKPSQAGGPDTDHGAPAATPSDHGKPDTAGPESANAPVATPNDGGTGTADTASGGNSENGTGTAADHSGGASSAGADNAGSHRP